MKILFVSGEDDYGANYFEEVYGTSQEALNKALKKAEESGGSFSKETKYGQFHVIVAEFGEVDNKFINFIFNEIQDYDESKHKNFYVLEEKESTK